MDKKEFLMSVEQALTGSEYERFAHSAYMNSAATAMVLGVGKNRVKALMEGYERQIGHTVRYAKIDVYNACKKNGTLA